MNRCNRLLKTTLARKAVKLFTQSMDEAGFGEGRAGPGRPRKDAEMDADYLLLRTPEEFEQWERLKDRVSGLSGGRSLISV